MVLGKDMASRLESKEGSTDVKMLHRATRFAEKPSMPNL